MFSTAHAAMVRRLVRMVVGRARNVLDVGGRLSPYTKTLSVPITVLDLPSHEASPSLGVSVPRQHHLKQRPNVTVVFGDITDFSFPQSFDAALMIEVIEHIEADRKALQNTANSLADEGVLLLTTPNGAVLPCTNPHHVRHNRPEELRDKLSEHFAEVEVTPRLANNRYRELSWKSPLLEWERAGFRQFIWQSWRTIRYRLSVSPDCAVENGVTLVAVCRKPRRVL